VNKSQILAKAEKFVRERLGEEATGHDYWHAVRVRNNARAILGSMGEGDSLIVELAALLHDVGDFKVAQAEENDSTIAQKFLEQQKIPPATIKRILFIIDNLSFGKNVDLHTTSNLPIEFLIVQDADRLDALGAIGIGRAFAYGGSCNRPIYDPNYKPNLNITREWYVKSKTPTIQHFDEKLFKLKDMMNTAAARQIAEKRDEFMHEFYDRFLREWNGEE